MKAMPFIIERRKTMPKNHEARLFVLSKLSKKTNKSLGYLVFRTRDAATLAGHMFYCLYLFTYHLLAPCCQ